MQPKKRSTNYTNSRSNPKGAEFDFEVSWVRAESKLVLETRGEARVLLLRD